MIIGFDAKRAFNNGSGLGNYSRDHLRLCHALIPEAGLRMFTPKVKTVYRSFSQDWENAEVILPSRGFGKISPSWWRSFGLLPELRRHRIDVFHGLSASLPAGIDRWNGKKVVTVHDLIFEKFPRWYTRADRIIHRRKLQHAVKAADIVVAISQETADDLHTFYDVNPDKVRVIYQSCHPAFRGEIDLSSLAVPAFIPEQYALYVGTVEERKHLGELLEVVQRVGDIPLVVVGKKTAYFDKIASLAESLQREKLLFFAAPDMQQLAAIYRNAAFLVYPSQAEGFGIPVIEALFSDIPVLAGNAPCLREAGGDACIYVNPLDIDEMEGVFRVLQYDKERRQKMIAAGKKHRERFMPEHLAEQWRVVYGLEK
jgi:glycosyltransferase involved in cell wall biosynthesis